MDNIPNIEVIINFCAQNNYFNSITCFIKQVCHEQLIVAITNNSRVDSKHNIITYNSKKYHLFTINQCECINLILSKSPLLYALFNKTICIKDETNLARKILLALNPIKDIYNNIGDLSVLQAWSSYKNEIVHSESFSIRFNGFDSDIQFYYGTLIPCLSPISVYLKNYNTQLQFFNNYGIKSAVYTIFLNDTSLKNEVLDSMQRFLFNNSPELLLNDIQIPYNRPYEQLEIENPCIYSYIVSLVSEIQNSIFLLSEKSVFSQNYAITEIYYAYIMFGKLFFDSKESFFNANTEILHNFIRETSSYNFRYILNSEITQKAILKIKSEYYRLCISNYDSLYNNYYGSLIDWLNIEQQVKHFELNENSKEILSMQILHVHDKIRVFQQVVVMLFKMFDIPSFYKSYIPYSIEFLKHEI